MDEWRADNYRAVTDTTRLLLNYWFKTDLLLPNSHSNYFALGAVAVVVFGLYDHILATYVAEFIGEESQLLHLISIAVVIALAMPLKHQLERLVEGVFARRMVEV